MRVQGESYLEFHFHSSSSMKLFRRKSSPKDGNKQKRSSRGFDIRRRSSSSNVEEKYSLLDAIAALETESQVSSESISPKSLATPREPEGQNTTHTKAELASVDGENKDSQVNMKENTKDKYELVKIQDKYEIVQFSEALDAAHSSAKTQRDPKNLMTKVFNDVSKKITFASEVETREDPPGDQNFQYESSSGDRDEGSNEVLKQAAPTPRETPAKSKIMGFLKSPRKKPTSKPDPLNTTIETSPSSDSEDPPTSTSNSPVAECRDSADEPVDKNAPTRKGPVEITNVDLSRLIKHKNAPPKKREEPTVLKPLKANRSRPPPMSLSKRNEEQFQRFVQRQNRGRKVRESQYVPSFH